MDEDGSMEDHVGVQMNQFQLIIIEEASEKIRGGQSKTLFDEMREDYHLVGVCLQWTGVAISRSPIDDAMFLQKLGGYRPLQILFYHP